MRLIAKFRGGGLLYCFTEGLVILRGVNILTDLYSLVKLYSVKITRSRFKVPVKIPLRACNANYVHSIFAGLSPRFPPSDTMTRLGSTYKRQQLKPSYSGCSVLFDLPLLQSVYHILLLIFLYQKC
jgi:hypothetical protein